MWDDFEEKEVPLPEEVTCEEPFLSLDCEGGLTYGYDNTITLKEHLSLEERQYIASKMIKRWEDWAK